MSMLNRKRPWNVYLRTEMDYGDGHREQTDKFIGTVYGYNRSNAVRTAELLYGYKFTNEYWSCDGYRKSYLYAR